VKTKSNHHFVLVNKKTGKQASIKGHHNLANRLFALTLHSTGRGGGITTLLLPRTVPDQQNIRKLMATYEVKQVVTRTTKATKIARNAVMDDDLMACLAVMFEHAHRGKPRRLNAPVREFSSWVSAQLDNGTSEVSKLTGGRYPELASRKASWWEKQISRRKNTNNQ